MCSPAGPPKLQQAVRYRVQDQHTHTGLICDAIDVAVLCSAPRHFQGKAATLGRLSFKGWVGGEEGGWGFAVEGMGGATMHDFGLPDLSA